MKKLILIAIMVILCVSFVSAADYLFVVDNEGMASDVVHTINTIENLKNKELLEEGDYESTVVQELDESELDDKVSIFIVNNEGTVVVGKDLDASYMNFAVEAADSLKEVSGIEAEIIYSHEDKSKELFEEEPEEEVSEPELYEEPVVEEEPVEEPEPTNGVEIIEPEDQEPQGFFATIINWFKNLFS